MKIIVTYLDNSHHLQPPNAGFHLELNEFFSDAPDKQFTLCPI